MRCFVHKHEDRTMIHGTEGGPKSTKFINLIPSTLVAWLLQYSGSRVEHRDKLSSHK